MFKVGDKIEGTTERYMITRMGWQGVVKDIINRKMIKVVPLNPEEELPYEGSFTVNADCFKLLEPAPEPIYITESFYV